MLYRLSYAHHRGKASLGHFARSVKRAVKPHRERSGYGLLQLFFRKGIGAEGFRGVHNFKCARACAAHGPFGA